MASVANYTYTMPGHEQLFDVCIFCALPEEVKALIEVFSEQCKVTFKKDFSSRDNREFRKAIISNNKGEPLSINVSWPPKYGPTEASLHFKTILDEFKPRFAVMTGICAGDKRKIKLGDLVVAERSFAYDSGKVETGGEGRKVHLHDADTQHPDQHLLQYARMFNLWEKLIHILLRPISKRQQREWIISKLGESPTQCFDNIDSNELKRFAPNWRKILQELQAGNDPILSKERTLCNPSRVKDLAFGEEEFPYKDPPTPKCYIAPIASGSAVRADDPFHEVRYPVRKTIAIDMESAAFYRAAADYPGLRSFLVKGVSDYADEDKDDSYHRYAAALSAIYALSFIKEYVNSERMPRLTLKPSSNSLGQIAPTEPITFSYRGGSLDEPIRNYSKFDLRSTLDSTYINTFESSDSEEKIISLLVEAKNSINKKSALDSLQEAKYLCEELMRKNNQNGYSLMIGVFSELAREAKLQSKRDDLWGKSVSLSLRGFEKFNNFIFVDLLSRKAVDFVQDPYAYIPTAEANHLLSRVKSSIDALLENSPSHERSILLARKSALLRNMSKFQATRVAEKRMSQWSLRCAERAIKEDPESWSVHLERGLSLWHIAQFDTKDKDYHNRLKAAEDSFWESITLQPTVYNLLSLCNFFRLTYQTIPFLECFDLYARHEYNKRGFLRRAFMFGEVAIQLWYNGYPSVVTDSRLEEADRLLESAINSECNDARHIIDLAFIKAAKKELTVGMELIDTLHSLSKRTSWSDVAKIVSNAKSEDDLITRGFAMGITDSSVWNKLGTFAFDFLQDTPLAISLYKQSLSLNGSNAIAMTNLARSLLATNTQDSIQEANMWISKAASCAHRRFRWWRNVREQIQQKLISFQNQPPQKPIMNIQTKLKRLADLYRNYQILHKIDDFQIRNDELRRLVDRLFCISLGNSFKSHRDNLKWFQSSIMQIDVGFCFFEKHIYRVETRWTPEPVDIMDIVLFRKMLGETCRKGLIISVTGFTERAIQEASEIRRDFQILLMDGKELECILQGSPSLDEAIRLKQISFAKELNPYFRINPAIQFEVSYA